MPEITYVTIDELYSYYKKRHEKGNQVRNTLNEKQLQILEEIELRYRLLSIVIHFCANLLTDRNLELNESKKLCKQILNDICKGAMPEESKKTIPDKIRLPKECKKLLDYRILTIDIFLKDLDDEEIDTTTLFLDMLEAAEAILKYLFAIRESNYCSVCTAKDKIA